ncbi:MAG: hypothetical protein ACK2UJ_03585 [Candidatus Promineifilaceae bacterium]|jgi:hypothetical protein
MKRYVWQFYAGLILCCVSGLLLFKISPVAVRGFTPESPDREEAPAAEGNVFLPVIFNNFSHDIKGLLAAGRPICYSRGRV